MGTTDITIAEVSDVDGAQMVEVLSSHGDVFLGGQNYDNAIATWLIDEFAKDHPGIDLRKDPMAYSRIIEAAEKAKCELSSSTETEINLPYITVADGVPQMLVKTLTRANYYRITDDLTQRICECVRVAIEKSGKSLAEIDDFLLVGGLTRGLNIQEALTKEFGKNLIKSLNPDEAVALGAARQANIINGGAGSDNLLLLDVTPISLGIETMGEVMTKLIEANTTIPVKKSQVFSTAVDNQPAVTLKVLQGERVMSKDNKEIGLFNLDGIAPARRGVPQIEVTFEIDANGILSVSAKDKATGNEQHITIENSNSLSQEEIDRIKKEAEDFKKEDEKKAEELKKINEIDGYAYAVESSLEQKELAAFFTEDDKTKIKELGKKIHDAVIAKKLDEAESAQNELKAIYEPIIQKAYAQAQQTQGNTNHQGNDFNFADFANGPFGKNNPYASNTASSTTNNTEDVEFEEV